LSHYRVISKEKLIFRVRNDTILEEKLIFGVATELFWKKFVFLGPLLCRFRRNSSFRLRRRFRAERNAFFWGGVVAQSKQKLFLWISVMVILIFFQDEVVSNMDASEGRRRRLGSPRIYSQGER
jgi:hypothetical protein